jgi:hypothetical protein
MVALHRGPGDNGRRDAIATETIGNGIGEQGELGWAD